MVEVENVWGGYKRVRVRAGWRSVRGLLGSVTLWLALHANAHAADALVTEAVVNAPIETVWALFTTAAGYQELGAAQADVDLRVGGLVRTQANARGTLDDENSRAREILAFDPLHMLASRPVRLPAHFPNRDAIMKTWTVIYFNSIAGVTTHVRVVALGYDDTAPSRAARAATDERHRATLDRIVKRYRPQCAHCARPQ